MSIFVDHAMLKHKLPYQSVDGTTDASTNSTIPQDIDQMTLTVAGAGTYLITLSMNVYLTKPASSDRYAQVRVVKGVTTLFSATFIRLYTDPSMNLSLTVTKIASLSAGDVVKAKWWVSNADSYLYNFAASQPSFYFRSLMIIKIA